ALRHHGRGARGARRAPGPVGRRRARAPAGVALRPGRAAEPAARRGGVGLMAPGTAAPDAASPGPHAALEAQIDQWRGYVRRREAISAADVDEMEDHLRERVEDLRATGLDDDRSEEHTSELQSRE